MSIGSKKSAAFSYTIVYLQRGTLPLLKVIPVWFQFEKVPADFFANLCVLCGFFRGRLVGALIGFGREGDAGDLLALAKAHNDHTLRRAPEPLDVAHRHPDHGAAGRDQDQLLAFLHGGRAGELAAGFRQLDGLDPEPAPALDRVVRDARPLAVSLVGDDEDVELLARDRGRDHLVALAETHALHAGRRAPHRPRLVLSEPDRLPLPRDE